MQPKQQPCKNITFRISYLRILNICWDFVRVLTTETFPTANMNMNAAQIKDTNNQRHNPLLSHKTTETGESGSNIVNPTSEKNDD